MWYWLIGALLLILFVLNMRFLDRWLRVRRSHERLWRSAFTPGEFVAADRMLAGICDAFNLPVARRFALRPSDDLWAIYRRRYYWGGVALGGDVMELEELYGFLMEAFGFLVDEISAIKPLTVGALVRKVARPRTATPGGPRHSKAFI